MASTRLQQESFRKRKNNFIRRGHEISDRYKVGVWICIRKENGQCYIYNSNPLQVGWPPSIEQLDATYPVPVVITPEHFASEKQPLKQSQKTTPVSLLPGYLPTPPVPNYSPEVVFSSRVPEEHRK